MRVTCRPQALLGQQAQTRQQQQAVSPKPDILEAAQGLGVLPWLIPGLVADDVEPLQAVGRNSRVPKKANHGKRPNSHVARRKKRVK